MHDPEPRLPGVSVREAAIRLGTSESDIRRRIKRGVLAAESIARPGGTLLRVLLPEPDTHQPIEPEATPDTRQEPPAATQALVDALAAERAERQQLAAENAALRERAARAESDAVHLAAQLAAERRRWWHRWWPPA